MTVFADLAAKLGIDPNALSEPEPLDGPVIMPCGEPTENGRCPGSLRAIDDQTGPIWALECDKCGFQAGVPAAKLDPRIRSQRRLEQSGVPLAFLGCPFEEDADNRSALFLLRAWVDDFRKGSPLPAPAIWGLQGRGKSHLLTALCVRLIRETETSVMFRSTRQLLRELQRFDDERERSRTWHRAVSVDVLALDDLGAQQLTDWRHDQVAELIDERYANERPILVATNFRPADWEQMLDARSVSRLRGMTFQVELVGRDRRQQSIEAAAA